MMQHQQVYPQTICIPQHIELQQQQQEQDPYSMFQHNASNNSSNNQAPQWPAHMAHRVTDSIHSQVQTMLENSRLTRKPQHIRLMKPTDFRQERVLGKGAFSQVSAVQVADSPRLLACKHLKPELMNQPEQFRTAAAELAYEAHMLSSMDHPHILKIRGWAENGIASFDAGRHDSFFLLLDMLDETLDQRIQTWNIQDDNDANILLDKLRVLNELASALHYVHEQGIVFRDLKPDNIGFANDSTQLFDFGLSRELPQLDTTTPFYMSGKVGTIRYMAPEVVLHQPYNVSADVYSWSMVAYEVLTGGKPYDGWTPELHADYVCKGGMRPATTTANMREDLAMMLHNAWHADPALRPTLPQLMMQLQQIAANIQAEEQQRSFVFELEQSQPEIYIDLNDNSMFMDDEPHFAPQQQQRPKLKRCNSSDSIETIETSSMSADSLDWW